MKLATQLQVNALAALIILGVITWQLLAVIRANDLAAHESQILGAALAACVGGIVYVARTFANQNECAGVCERCEK